MTILITGAAADDIAEGYLFYEKQSERLGEYFKASIFADIRSLVIYAGSHEMADKVKIFAVVDTRRNPVRIKNRL